MRIAGLILGILGGLAAALLGIKWLSDAASMKELIGAARNIGVDTAEIDKLITSAYFLLASGMLGIVGGVLAFKRKGKIAASLMLAGVVAPALFAPRSLVFTWLLLVGCMISFLVKSKEGESKSLGRAA